MQWISDSIASLFTTQSTPEGTGLQKSGILTKEQLRNFFQAGYTMFDDEGVKEQLKAAARKRQNVSWIITEMQKKIFENQGIDGKFGIGFLGKIRELYGADAQMLEDLMKFVDREEMALDEAELPADKLIEKLEMKEWAMQQYGQMRAHMRQMTSDQQREFMRQQQVAMTAIQQERKEILAKAETMTPEEQKKYISEQVKKLQNRFSLGNSAPTNSNCSSCPSGECGPQGQVPSGAPSMGSVMSSDEQLQFFKSLNGGRR